MLLTDEERRSTKETFSALIGLPLSDMWRYMGCQKFEFGEQKPNLNRKGEATTWADWGLVVSGNWRIEGPQGFVLSWEHCGPTPERRDDHADSFYEALDTSPPTVQSVEISEDGALRLQMSGGYLLGVDPRAFDEDNVEEGRFMPPDDPRGDLVLDNDGLGWSGV